MFSRTRLLNMCNGLIKQQLNFPVKNQASLQIQLLQCRHRSSTPINTVIMFVPQQEAWIVERMGKFHRILEPGLNILIPLIDNVKYVQSLKEIAIDVPKQSAITSDNVTLNIDGVLYLRILDAYLASYGVEDPEFAITQLAQTTMRSELGKISLDKVFRERESLNVSIVDSINKASEAWGITCLRYEIRDIKLPTRVQEAMQMQVEAERKKRAAILESEGIREAEINVAEGKRRSRILASEAEQQEQINKANGEAAALLAVAEARAGSLRYVASALRESCGSNAASLTIAEQYVQAFNKLARTNNTLILPANAGDVSNLVAQPLISAEGKLMPPVFLVLKEQGGKFGPVVEANLFIAVNVYVTASKSGKLTSDHFKIWLEEVYFPNVGKTSALLLDAWSGHCPKIVEEAIPPNKNIILKKIPTGTTGYIQPLDVYGFRIWKNLENAMTIYNKVSTPTNIPTPPEPDNKTTEKDKLAELFSDDEFVPQSKKQPESTLKLK